MATDTAKIGLGDTPTVEDGEPDVAEWPSISVYDTAAEKFADVGRYKVRGIAGAARHNAVGCAC